MEKFHVEKKDWSYWHINIYRSFQNRWLRIPSQYLEIQYSGSNMTDGKLKNHLISIKIGFPGFFGLLFSNPSSDFQKARKNEKNIQFWLNLIFGGFLMSLMTNLPINFFNSKWRIEYSGKGSKIYPVWMQIDISGFLDLLDLIKIKIIQCWWKLICRGCQGHYKSTLRFWKFIMTDCL